MSDSDIDALASHDHVTVFGFACTHTPALMPLPIWLAHQVVRRLDEVRTEHLSYLAPDGSCQVGVAFADNKPVRIHSITLVVAQRDESPELSALRQDIQHHVINPVFAAADLVPDDDTVIGINPEGSFLEGGPAVHAGLTGRKNGIDTYGEFARQSGAALSGKDPSRIDRVGAYAARHVAKNIVAAELADRCEVQLSYTIGQAHPVSVRVDTFGTGQVADRDLTQVAREVFDFRLGAIIRRFGLRKMAQAQGEGIFQKLAVYGHVGRSDLNVPWEATDHVDLLHDRL